jgi:class 3 adenylate cyclase/pimeloyl-ACP methyl ester carboxylesterase
VSVIAHRRRFTLALNHHIGRSADRARLGHGAKHEARRNPRPAPYLHPRSSTERTDQGNLSSVDEIEHVTRYAAVGDDDVAYQVVGDGPFDLLCCYDLGSQVDLLWQLPPVMAGMFAAFARTIVFDRRGTGASDPVPRGGLATWEEWTEDIGAVLDAAQSKRAVLYAENDAGAAAILYAALHPERVSALVLLNAAARYLIADDYPIGLDRDTIDAFVGFIQRTWGTDELVRTLFPSLRHDPELIAQWAQMERAAATPRTAAAQFRYILENIDVRRALPLVQVPTLVLATAPSPFAPIEHSQYLLDHIDGARLIELAGANDVNAMGDLVPRVIDEVIEFVTGQRPHVETDRVLTTALFTDIVGSTHRLSEIGDRRWRTLLDAHDRTTREQLRRYGGREIKTTGDGFLASFDGPARGIRCARDIIAAAARLGIDVRAGLHTGECERRGDDLSGIAIHIAARVGALARPGEVLVSSTVRDLVAGAGITFEDRGPQSLKGISDQWRVLAVDGA